MSVGERKYCPDGKNGGDDKSGSMVNGKKCESKDPKKPEKESNLSPLAPAGLIRVGCRYLPVDSGLPWTMFLSAQKAILRGWWAWLEQVSPKKEEAAHSNSTAEANIQLSQWPRILGHLLQCILYTGAFPLSGRVLGVQG